MSTTVIIFLVAIGSFIGMIMFNYFRMKKMPETVNSQRIVTLNNKNFKAATKSGLTLVDFWAPWCGPCKMMAPVLNEVAEHVGEEASIGKLNVDHNQPIAQKYKVRSIPTLILFRNGLEVNRYVGVKSKKFLLAEIQKHG